jgi:MFS family permease
MANKLIWSC